MQASGAQVFITETEPQIAVVVVVVVAEGEIVSGKQPAGAVGGESTSELLTARLQRISPCFWFDDQGRSRSHFLCLDLFRLQHRQHFAL